MINNIEELGKVLQYRNTNETYDETINRYSKIISNWHSTHTGLINDLRALQRKLLKELEECDPSSDEAHFLMGKVGAMVDVIKLTAVDKT